MADSLEELAYQEAVRGLAEQSGVLGDLQARAGTLLAATAIVTSFLGGRALSGHLHAWSILAVGAFVLASLAVIGVLWPRHRWRFVVSARALLGVAAAEQSSNLLTAHRELALRLEVMYDENQERMRELFWLFSALLRVLDRGGGCMDRRARMSATLSTVNVLNAKPPPAPAPSWPDISKPETRGNR